MRWRGSTLYGGRTESRLHIYLLSMRLHERWDDRDSKHCSRIKQYRVWAMVCLIILINSICVWKSLLNSNDSIQSLKSLGKLTIRNGTLIIESSLRLVRLLINNYEHSRRTRHTAIYSLQRLEWLWLHGVTHRYGLPAFPRQLDW